MHIPYITRKRYAMQMPDGENAEITMYGEIVETRPFDWQTGEPVDGDYIIQSEFLQDLEQLSMAKTISIRLNSVGGDAGAAITIHNRLRELARNGAALTCIVDGVAMSGGSIIMCACDRVKVNPSSLIMIHKCLAFLFGGYNADDLREMAAHQDEWDKAQIACYKRKCGLSDTVISHMMAETTYMTGEEALGKGFADELLEDAKPLNIAASADGRSLFVRGRQLRLASGMFAPDNIPTVETGATVPVQINTQSPTASGGKEGGKKTMAETVEELRAEYPELTAQLEAAAMIAACGAAGDMLEERRRIQEIDAIASLYDDETVREAKYGENACTAQEMTYRAAKKMAVQGKQFLAALDEDNRASGVQNIPAAGDPGETPAQAQSPEQSRASARASIKALLGKEEA